MSSVLGLKVGATALTLLSFAGASAFVGTHVKNPAAPLHPPVVRITPAPPTSLLRDRTAPRFHLEPSVRVTELPPLTWTYVS